MEESQYNSDNPWTPSDPLATILADMSAKLEGISRLEKKLEDVTTNFTGGLDFLKTEIANLSEARKKDGAELTRLQSSINGVSRDLQRNEEVQEKIENKLKRIVNTSNKNFERIDRLEQNNAKLSESIKLLEEREKRRSLGARPKVLENMNSDSREVVKSLAAGSNPENSSSLSKNLSYAYQLSKGISGLRSLSLLKE